MKQRITASLPILALTAAFALTIVVTVTAGPGPGPGKHGGPGKMGGGPFGGDRPTTVVLEMMSKRLDLTAEQKEKITPILENTRSELRKTAEGTKLLLEKTREDISAVLTDEQKAKMEKSKEGFAGAIGGFAREHGPEIRERVHDAGQEIAVRAAIGSLDDLTDEQKTKLKTLQEKVSKEREAIQAEVKPKMEELKKQVKTELEATLTDEQEAKLKERMEKMKDMGPKHGPRAEQIDLPDGPGRGPDAPRRRGAEMRGHDGDGPDERPSKRPEPRAEIDRDDMQVAHAAVREGDESLAQLVSELSTFMNE